MGDAPAWEALRDGAPVAEFPTSTAARCYVREAVEKRVGDLVDSLTWHTDSCGEELWLRVEGEETQSGWAIRPVGGGGRRG